MLQSLLYFAGAFALAWLISGVWIAALSFVLKQPQARIVASNCGALVVSELLYRTIDARFFFLGGAVIYALAQVTCLLSQWLLIGVPKTRS